MRQSRYKFPTALSTFAVALLLSGASLSAGTSSVLDDACWDETFVEDFNLLSLWSPEQPDARWKTSYIWDRDIIINNELQYYVDPDLHAVNPFSINDGILSITASKTPASLRPSVKNSEYISGVLTTEKNFSQKYGRFEARARMPRGQGLWPAFWLLPSFDQWPAGVAVLPEIDVMEYLGHQNTTYHTTLHTNQTGELTSHPYDHNVNVDLSESFHVYSVVWDAKSVRWYFDHQKIASHPTPTDFTRPVHFLLNLAVGGNWPGNPDAQTRFPATFEVDYVKAYEQTTSCPSQN